MSETTHIIEASKLAVPDFDGGTEFSAVWWTKFQLLAKRFKWDDTEKCIQLGVKLTHNAAIWYSSLEDDVRTDWARLEPLFQAEYIKGESRLILDSKLQNAKLSDYGSIEDYYANVLSLSSKLKRSTEDMASAFIRGLPNELKMFCLGSENHTVASYLARSKLYLSAGACKAVTFKGAENTVFNVLNEPNQDVLDQTQFIVNQVTENLTGLVVEKRDMNYAQGDNREGSDRQSRHGASGDRNHRSMSPSANRYNDRSGSRERGRSYDRGYNRGGSNSYTARNRNESKSPSRERNGGRDGNRGRTRNFERGRKRGPCYNCGREGHVKRECRKTFNRNKGGSGYNKGMCYNCGLVGHHRRECRKPFNSRGGGQSYNNGANQNYQSYQAPQYNVQPQPGGQQRQGNWTGPNYGGSQYGNSDEGHAMAQGQYGGDMWTSN